MNGIITDYLINAMTALCVLSTPYREPAAGASRRAHRIRSLLPEQIS